ncbi:hypothetical protein J7431_19315 [Xanthomonas phaseoli pv. dieffenbachiae]|uniref:hypothetical protein n=1 Tax=Xanthomonas TaxID=338 RepID=UPI000B33A775|nr:MULTISPECIES: hypothetical protein [Xanthomonas]MBO9749335.1 hypothetical protein [Xanthomonas phaseoli pv. dieffenbachiae]MBO9753399.1 hypothetical protein [Xanthomonas phaseoli pv. dieffenbachiae]MBO9891591.1 hypothetical protein [Xanthomonas sp. D-36-1]
MNAQISELNRSAGSSVDDVRVLGGRDHLLVPCALPPAMCQLFERYALLHLNSTDYFTHDEPTQSLGRYADALGESMLIQLQPVLERLTGRRLLPTYSFLRFYTSGSSLTRHTDRDACEFSATLTLGYSGASIWPVWVHSQSEDKPVLLDVGDMLLYRGIEVPHWREPLEEGYWLQLFVHYVDASGPHAKRAFDERNSIGPNNTWAAVAAEQTAKTP